MRVHLIKKQAIEDYAINQAPARACLENWLSVIKLADWENPKDIKKTFSTADILGCGSKRTVFNLGGNNYRIICKYHFGSLKVHLFICWIGTHTEYDELCERRNQFTVMDY